MSTTTERTGGVTRSLPNRPLTYEEFLAWCEEDCWAEWVNGEVIVLSPASTRHQLVK